MNHLFVKATITCALHIFSIFNWNLALAQERDINSQDGYLFSLNEENIATLLLNANESKNRNPSLSDGIELNLPDPTGKFETYKAYKANFLSEKMLDLYPGISTYTAFCSKYPNRIVNITLSESGIHVIILQNNSMPFFIDKNISSSNNYKSYYGESDTSFECSTDESNYHEESVIVNRTPSNGATFTRYRLAVVITDQYEAANGGGSAAITVAVNTVNDMNAIYKRELAVEFILTVAAEDPAIYNISIPSSASASSGGTAVSNYFALGAYDVGHVFHNTGASSSSGQATLGVVCNSTLTPPLKARAWSQGNPNNNYRFLTTVMHETAHQFSATHIFNCNDDNTNEATSYEPGSGTTLMSYLGACDIGQNITNAAGITSSSRDPYFHSANLEQMLNYIAANGSICSILSSTGNTPPDVDENFCNIPQPIIIPISTPFELYGSATDADGDSLTYCWEQFDTGPPYGGPGVACNSTTGPIFRSYLPTTSPLRSFPNLFYILNNANIPSPNTVGECLPSQGRILNFRLTVRDNNPNGGGLDCEVLQLQVDGTKGPLKVTTPNTTVAWTAGSMQTIIWDVNNTSSICNQMNILLSLDGGLTFPFTLSSNTENDGSETILLPSNIPSVTTARIKIESNCLSCVKIFDISNVNFSINSMCNALINNLCNTGLVEATLGSSLLDLEISPIYSSPTNSISLTTVGPFVYRVYNLDPIAPGIGTCTTSSTAIYGSISSPFVVEKSGDYTFSHAPSGFAILAVYSGSYLSGAPCTNYYGSNAYDQNGIPGGDVSAATTFSLYLTECMEYTLVLFGSLGLNKTITITAPSGGNFYPNNTPPTNPDYNYTYLAVNDLSGNIDQINASADFTNLPVGNYCIYGLHYRSGGTPPPPIVNPSNYIGQPLAGIYGMDSCQSVSGNCKPVSVTCIDFPEADAGPDQTICYGSFADLTASGGESYVWSNNLGTSATVNTGTLLTTTTYNVTITNNIGCTATDQVTVNVDIVTANAGIDQSLCSGQSATLTASGGTSYLWSDGLGNTSIVSTPPLNATITYVVTVTNGNCTSTDQVTVNVGNVTANAGTDQSLCSGQSASLTASGGTSYLWSNGLGNMATVTTPPLITTITYSVTVTNGNCTATDQVTVNVGNVIANAGADQSLCSGQSATLTASGGTSYLWSDGLGNTSTVSTPPLTATITYVVTVTNGNCTATDQVTVNVGNVIANAGADQSLCSGQSATLTASGGTSYLWSDGLGNTSTVSTPPLTATITYVVTVTNGNCTATDQVTVNVGNVIANAGADQSLCSGQSATLTAGGGTSYQWSNGLGNMATVTTPPLITTITYSVTVTNGNCTDTDQVTVNVGNVIANAGADQSLCSGQSTTLTASGGTSYLWSNGLGNTAMVTTPFLNSTITYTVTVTNGNCTDTDQVTVNVGNISANAGVDQSICSEQSATLTASGGTSYQWSNGLGNMATVTTPPLITSITYSVTVTNGNCTDTDQVTVNVGNVIANAGADQSLCSGQSATLTASGGTGYQWSNGLGNTATVTTPTLNSTTTYTVTVTNGNCTASDQITVNVDNVNANAGTDQSLCTGQSATLTASGGTSYLWSNGLGNMATVTTPPLITTITYSVTVTSGNCTATDQVTVNVGNVTANAGTDQSLCTGQSATLTASGGTSYLWSNGLGNMATVTTPTLNTTITYSVTVTNGNCTASDQVTVNVGNIIANAGVDQSLCSGQSATLTASGGTSYLWSNGLGNMATVTTPPLNTSITYTVTVTNGNCTATDQITVNVGNINANAGEDKNICAGQTTTLIASGGNMYEWSNGLGNTAVVTTPSLSSTMSYTVTVTIGNCSATDAVNVTVTTVPANAGSDQTISSGSAADLTASGGGSYAWSNGLGTSAAVSTGPLTTTTTFTVTVTNNNCTATDQVTVNINNILATVSGLLETEVQDSIGNATVTATNINNNEVINATFVDTGVYLVNLPIGFDYKIEPSRNDNPLNGVTTWDIVLITKHILGITPLNSPYKIIAADVNASLSVTAFDLLAIRKMILQITDTFPNGTPSWVFVDHNYVFPNPTNPWFEAYPTVVNIDNLSTNVQADFIGVKLGDVNNSVLASQLLGEEERNMKGSLDLNVKDKAVAKNEVFTVDFSSRDFVAMGYQFTLNFNEASLEYAGFKPGALSVSEENFGVFNNAITTSWNGDTNLKGDAVLFSLNFKAKNAEQLSKVLTLGSRLTPAEAYSNTAELMDVNLAFSTGSVTNGNVFELYQNEPNPFSDFTTIGFNLPVSESAKLVVYNIEGRTVKVVEGNYSKGFNSVRLNKSELGAGGVFYYELSTSTGSSMKKMIVIE